MSRNARLQLLLFALLAGLGRAVAVDFVPAPATNPVARVVVAQGDHLLQAFLPDEAQLAPVFERGLTNLTHTTTASAAWLTLIKTNDVVGIKVFSEPGPLTGTHPGLVAVLVRSLLTAGFSTNQIVIWDKRRDDLHQSGFDRLGAELGVAVVGTMETGFDTNAFYLPDSPVMGSLVWGDTEFQQKGDGLGKKSYVSRLVSQRLTKLISVAPLINDPAAGVCGHFYSLGLGSVDNTRRFEGDPDRLAVALPELIALPQLGDRVALYVTDALLVQSQGGPASFLQYSTVLDQVWLSHDPVALDMLASQQVLRERQASHAPPAKMNFEIYTNAAMLQLGIQNPNHIQVETVR